nr:MAG: polyprotein [Canine picornavirus]
MLEGIMAVSKVSRVVRPTLPFNVFEQESFDELALLSLPGSGSMLRPKPLAALVRNLCFRPVRQGNFLSSSLPSRTWVVWNPVDLLPGYQLRHRNGRGDLYQIGWIPAAGNRFLLTLRPISGDALSEIPPATWFAALQYLGRTYRARWDLLNPPHARTFERNSYIRAVRQGNSQTNIYGNGNQVTTDVGANGWSPTTAVGDGAMASQDQMPSKGAGGSGAGSGSGGGSSKGNSVGSRYSKWWEPAAARGLEHGIDQAIGVTNKATSAIGKGLGAGIDALSNKLGKKSQDTRLMAIPPTLGGTMLATVPQSTQHGNTEIQSQAPYSAVVAYPPEPYPVLPNPDEPSLPGPSGDRAWLLDTGTWSEEKVTGDWIWGANALELGSTAYPPTVVGTSASQGGYPFPWSLVLAQPNCVWSMMYKQHSYWRAGARYQLTVNGSQFHAGTLVLFACPEVPDGNAGAANFVWPYAILNLTTGNTCTLELPYISPVPISSTDLLHAPWSIFIYVLSPLVVPTGSPTTLTWNLYVTPTSTEFYGLRYPVSQMQSHVKTRHVPGNGAFGTVVAGQEIPLVGVLTNRPPSDFLPGRPQNWLEFASRPGLVTDVLWTMADDPGLNLLTLPISPDALAGAATPIGFVMTLFSQWQGELKAQLLFTGSAQHYGRLVVAYTPPAPSPPTTMDEAMHGTYTVWDINGESTLDFTIPFISQAYWKTVDIGTPYGLLNNNGYLTLWVMNSLTGPSAAPPSARLFGFLLAGDSFRLRFQQNPALGIQAGGAGEGGNGGEEAGLAAPPSTTTLESGVPDTELKPRTTFDYTDTDTVPDTVLRNYFSFFRWFPLSDESQAEEPSLVMTPGLYYQIPTDPSRFNDCTLKNLLTAFTYFVADLRINLRVTPTPGYCGSLLVAFVPVGATVPTTLSPQALSNYTLVDQPFNGLGTQEIAISVPYTSPQSALFTVFNGWGVYNPTATDFGILHTNMWGTLILMSTVNQAEVTLTVEAWMSFGNFQGYCPRATPALGTVPSTVAAWAQGPPRLVKRPPPHVRARRQGADSVWLWFEDFDFEDRVSVVRVRRPTYVHWALRKTTPEGEAEQISLQNESLRAVVGYEKVEGEEVEEVDLWCWELATRQLGSHYPYSATSNCSTWVQDITGVECSNTGIALGVGIAGLAVASLLAVGAQTLRAERQGLSDLTKAASVVNQQNVDQAMREFHRGVNVVEGAAVRVEAASQNILAASDNVNFQHLENAAETIAAAAERMASSIDGARDTVENLGNTLRVEGDNAIARFLRWVARIFGYLLVLFGSPTPMSIAGLLVLICTDLQPAASKFFNKSGDVLGSIWCWIATRLGLKVSPEEAAAAAQEAAAEPQCSHSGVQSFNHWMTAARNVEWLLDKVLALLDKLLRWLGIRAADDPQTKLANCHDSILALYKDSLVVLQKVEMAEKGYSATAIKSNMRAAEQMLGIAHDAKSSTHASLCTQALRNYTVALAAVEKGRSGNRGARPEPLVVYLYGKPGCGKSVVASLLAAILAKKLGNSQDDYYSPASVDCQFYDGYHGQPVHLIDDIGQDPEGRDWADFPNLVSTAPFIVPMASLEDKGMYYQSKVIIATSNFAGPNERSARSIAAIDRRLHIRINVTSAGFDVEEALTPCGPPTKHFACETPLVRLEGINLKFDQRSLYIADLDSLDDLVDLIMTQVAVRASNVSRFTKLIPQGLPDADHHADQCTFACNHPPGECTACLTCCMQEDFSNVFDAVGRFAEAHTPDPPPVVLDSTATTVEDAVRANQPVPFIEKLWRYRRPIFAVTSFLTCLSFLGTVIGLAIVYRKQRQGAYSGVGKPAPPKPPRQPSKVVTRGAQRQNLSPAIPKIAENVVPIRSGCGSEVKYTMSALFLHGRVCVTASHLLHGAEWLEIAGLKLKVEEVRKSVDGELVLLEIPTREYRSLVRFLKPECTYQAGFLVSSILSGTSYVRFWDCHATGLSIEDVIEEPNALVYRCSSFPGLCGSPIIADDPGGISIRGIHVAGVPGYNGMGCEVTQARFERMMCGMSGPQSLIVPIENVGPPSHVNRRSKIRPSPAYGAFPVKKEPAVLSQKDARLREGVSFDVQVFDKHGKGDLKEPWPGLEEAFDLYFSDFPKEIRTLSLEEAINGTPMLDGIDMGQSPGYPWTGKGRSRRSLFTWDGTKWVAKPELVDEVMKCLEDPVYVYTTSLKDELRPLSKVEAGGTRLIEAAPIHAILAGRMLLGGLFEYLQARPGEHGCAVGCNPDRDWTKFFWDFSPFEQVFDLDYKGFDATLPSICFSLVSKHLSERIHDPRLPAYILSISSSVHVFGQQFYRMVGGNPSGCVGTSILNTIINNCCLLSALMSHPKFEKWKILCYGDDVVYATEPVIHPKFVKEFYDKWTPLKVTPADKSDEFKNESTIYDVTFLKRWFVPDEQRAMYIHPVIDPDVYEQSVMWLRTGDFQDVVTSLCYLAHHAGPKNYERWCSRVREKVESVGVEVSFLPYSFLQYSWLKLVSA